MITFRRFLGESIMTPEHDTQYGSNPGGIHTDEHGQRHYVKYYHNPDQGRVEALTGKIYGSMGIHTLNPQFGQVNGKHAVTTRWNPSLESMHHSEFERLSPEQHQDIGRIYHGAVLTKNWDAIGLSHDNVMRHSDTGAIHSIDQGGAFHFRAQGGPKDYGSDIAEHQSLRHNDGASGHVFHHVLSKDPGAERAGRAAVGNMDMSAVQHHFEQSGLSNADQLHDSFVKRRIALLAK